MNETRIKISVKEGVIELAGSEAFVSQQIENLKEIIAASLQQIQPIKLLPESITQERKPPLAAAPTNADEQEFHNVLHIEGDKVKLLKTMPGSMMSKRAVNTALVYLWGKRSIGVETVTFKELRDLCEHQGCLDAANFSAHMKSARQQIVIDGPKGSSLKACKLTRPGIDAAEKLLKQLNGSKS